MINYRKATKDDISLIIKLRIAFLIEHQGKINQSRLDVLNKYLLNYFQQKLVNNEFIACLAFDNKEVVATSGLCFYTLPPTIKNIDGRIAYIMNMYTLPRYRRQGIAKQLFIRILEEAKLLGYRKICLHASKLGENLYRQFGFTEQEDTELVLNLNH